MHFKSIDPITSEKTVSSQFPFLMQKLWGLGTKFARTRGSTGASKYAGGDPGGSFTSEEERRGRNYNLASTPPYVIYRDCAGGRPS